MSGKCCASSSPADHLRRDLFSRRDFLRSAGILGGSYLLHPLVLAGCSPFTPGRNSRVAITKGMDIGGITRKALQLIGGMESVVSRGQTVFIKPNYISGGLDGHDPVAAGEIAHPEVVATVAEECVKAGAKKVLISEWVERPPKILFGGREGREGAQVLRRVELLNRRYGQRIHLFNLMDHTSYFDYFPSSTSLRFLAIPDVVSRADVKISIPSLKTHHQESPITLGMKNWMGIMPSILYGEPRYKLHEAGIHQVIVDISKAIRPDLTVIDGTFGMEGEGTTLMFSGRTVDLSSRTGGFLVLAGRDPVATDATGTRVISKNWEPVIDDELGAPYYVHHLRLANQQGLGQLRRSRIAMAGETLEEVAMTWKMPGRNTYPELPFP